MSVRILYNPLKYTPRGGCISFSATEKETDRTKIGCYEFIIEDNGIGMSDEFVKVMFDPFVRADDKRVAGQQGTGLGMSITKNIINMLDGDIEVESELNKGTKIITTVCFAFDEADGSEEEDVQTDSLDYLRKYRDENYDNVNVLLVEDNKINAEIASEILKMAGINVEHVWDGNEAIDRLSGVADDYYKLVFMDIQMPVMDGYTATRKIRSINRTYLKTVPIIAMSANAFAEDVAKSKAAGMNDHIAKPLNFDKLLEILKEYIK